MYPSRLLPSAATLLVPAKNFISIVLEDVVCGFDILYAYLGIQTQYALFPLLLV